MDGDIGRKQLDHDLPATRRENPEGDVFFITVCCERRGVNQLANSTTWNALCGTVVRREDMGDWRVTLLLVMPDHLHVLCAFNGDKPMRKVISDLKSWLAKTQKIRWQRDFFDHRLRSWESAEEKRIYILKNPLRAGLIGDGERWPFVMDRVEPR